MMEINTNSEIAESDSIKNVDWSAVHQEDFLYEDQCWTTCNGGFCCSNNHPDMAFQLIPTNGTTLLYMESEYAHLRENGLVFENTEGGVQPHDLSFDFGGPRPIVLKQTPCHLLGKCDGIVDKPLLCKLYPFLPVFDIEGELVDTVPASIFELTFEYLAHRSSIKRSPLALIESPSPCTVNKKKDSYFQEWSKSPELLDSLRHPYINFHLKAASLFSINYLTALYQNELLGQLEGRDFWTRWELQYLGGKLVDTVDLKQKIFDSYIMFEQKYGKFLSW
jgi:hypothetical protein